MRTPSSLRTIAFFLLSASFGAAAILMSPLHAQTGTTSALPNQALRPITGELPTPGSAGAVDPRILALQAQVASLQAQLNTLATAVQITPGGLVLQGSTVTILGGAIKIQAQGQTTVQAGSNLNLAAGSNVQLRAAATALVAASGIMQVRGSTVQLNNGTRAIAVLANGQVVTASPTVFSE
jgi:hypothetical protein